MEGQKEVWIFTERPNLLPELIGGGLELAGKLSANLVCLAAGPRELAEAASELGAGQVLWVDLDGGQRLVEDSTASIAALAQARRPILVLVGASKRGKVVAGRLAAALDTCVLPDILEFQVQDGQVLCSHLLFGGGARRVEAAAGAVTIATVGAGMFTAAAPTGRRSPVESVRWIEPAVKPRLVERKPKPPASVNLPSAKRVVCPGRGLARQEDLGMIQALAGAIQAEVGCSRPLAEGLNWLPRERYIGVSGAQLKSDLYIGIGVSGQAQHTVGISGCRVVVAINKDANAAIFRQADYGIVGDLYEIVPALTQALKNRAG